MKNKIISFSTHSLKKGVIATEEVKFQSNSITILRL